MRYPMVVILAIVMIGSAIAQPSPKKGYDRSKIHFSQFWPHSEYVPAEELRKLGTYLRLNVLGYLKNWNKIDTDPKVLDAYTRFSGVEIGPGNGDGRLIRYFELYLGNNAEFIKTAKQLDGKPAVVEGDLRIVHGPVQILFGSGHEQTGMTEYAHPRPRYVIKVNKLTPAPAGVPNVKDAPYIKIEVKGVLSTWGKNPSLRDITDGKGGPSTVIRTDQCNLLLFLGKEDKWLPRAKELHRKLVVARGELISVARNPPESKKVTRPFTQIAPLPFYLLDVSELQAAPVPVREPKDKNK